MQTLFVYGTLEYPQVVYKLLGTELRGEPAVLNGYARYLLVNRPYPGVIRQPEAQVDGVLYHGVTPKYLRLLDRYEDEIYERKQVKVIDSRGQNVDAWVYLIPLRFRKELTGRPWNRDFFSHHHLKRFVNVRC